MECCRCVGSVARYSVGQRGRWEGEGNVWQVLGSQVGEGQGVYGRECSSAGGRQQVMEVMGSERVGAGGKEERSQDTGS